MSVAGEEIAEYEPPHEPLIAQDGHLMSMSWEKADGRIFTAVVNFDNVTVFERTGPAGDMEEEVTRLIAQAKKKEESS
jgi:hypothetical protein